MKLNDYRQMMAYMRRPGFFNGTPPPKPEQKTPFIDKLKNLKEVAPALMPRSKVDILKMYMDEALKDGEITQEQHTEMLMPYFGELGEKVTEQIAVSDRDNFAIGGGVIEGEDLGTREGFNKPKGGYMGYVSPERLELEKKIPEIRKLFLEGNSILDITKKLNVDGKRLETILNELKGNTPLKKDGKIIDRGYAIPEDTERGKLYKDNRISKEDLELRGRGGKSGRTVSIAKETIEAARDASKTLTMPELIEKFKVSERTLRDYGITGAKARDKFKEKYIKPEVTKYGNKVLKVLEKNPSLIGNQNELFKQAKVPAGMDSGVASALKNNPTLSSGKKRFDIPKSISKLVPKIYGVVETVDDLFFKAGASSEDVDSILTKPASSLKEPFRSGVLKKATVFEHTFPKSLIPFIKGKKLQNELLMTGERTSPFLNDFKTRFDLAQKRAVEKYLKDGNLKEYNKSIKDIRDTVRKLTGGYEIGYIKFDKNGNSIPIVNSKIASEGLNEFGKGTSQKVTAFKNAKYTANLLKNFKKDPENINFSTLRRQVDVEDISEDVIKKSQEAAKAYEKAKPFLGLKDKFINFAKKNLNNPLVQTLFKAPAGKAALVTGAILLPSKLAAQEPENIPPGMLPEGSPGQINPEPEEVFDPERAEPGLALTAAAAPLATQKGRNLYGKFAKQIARGLGNTVRAVGSPLTGLTLAASEFADINPIRLAKEDEEGIFKYDEKFGSLKEDPSMGQAGAELLLPEQIKRVAGQLPKGIMSNVFGLQGLSKFGKLGALAARAPSVMTPVGLTLLGAEGIKKLYDEEQKKNRMIEAMDPEERLQFLEEEKATEEFMSRQSAAYGGRMGFADGPEDPKKRKFMKIMGGLASIPLLGRFIDIGTTAPKVAEVLRKGADGMPDFIYDLIAKVKAKAEATGTKYFTGNRADEFADVYQADNYVVTEKGNKITIREVDQDGDMLYKENQMEIDLDPETGGVTYNEASAKPDMEGKLKDVEEYIETDDLENMRKYTYDE